MNSLTRPVAVVMALAVVSALIAQQPPAKPPALLPPAISGKPYEPVTPAGGVVAKVNPIDRFQTPGQTPDALAAVASAKEAAGWLVRMSKADGRFVTAFDATLQREVPDADHAQAVACLALARMARFTGDERITATASQSVLTLLTFTKPDPADTSRRVPTTANKVGFAAVLATAVYDLPNPDAKLVTEADRLCRFLYSRLRENGSVVTADDGKGESNPAAAGECFQALMAADRLKAEAWKREAVERGVGFYRAAFQAAKSADGCGALLPAVCDLAVRTKSEAATRFAFEMADWVCDQQYTAADARNLRWVGGVRPPTGVEPTVQTVGCVEGLAAAATLCIQVPDADRFAKYRKAIGTGLGFARSLQFEESSTAHFDRSYRPGLVGGVHRSPSDGVVRAEATARLLSAQLRYLESGAERAE